MSYCFLDTETTGLDPDKDKILEIAWTFTDKHFNIIGVPRTFIVEHEASEWIEVWETLRENDYVYNMHEKSGLLASLEDGQYKSTYLDDIYEELKNDIEFAKAGLNDVHLAGFSVHFDKAFLIANDFGALFDTDSSERYFHHRMLDLSSFKLLCESSDIEVPKVDNLNPHRALSDVAETVTFARKAVIAIQEGAAL